MLCGVILWIVMCLCDDGRPGPYLCPAGTIVSSGGVGFLLALRPPVRCFLHVVGVALLGCLLFAGLLRVSLNFALAPSRLLL